MRIAMVSEHASPLAAIGGVDAGGQNVHVAALSAALVRRGHEVTVFTRRDSADLPPRVRALDGYTVEHVPAGPATDIPKDLLLPHMAEFARWLARRWSVESYDLAHGHFWMSGLASVAAAARVDIPVVHTFHALGTVKRRHQGAKDTSPSERVRLEATVARDVARVIATCSDEVVELARMGVPTSRVSIVPCGVDTAHFTPDGAVAERRTGRPRILTLGRLVERKGIDDTIRALALVPDAELIVAGGPDARHLDGDVEYHRLRSVAHECGVGSRVVFLGRVDHDDIPPLIRSADIVCITPWYEPFGIVPLEAMACGVPVVASAVGGLIDSVVDGVTGVHVPPHDPTALSEALSALLADPPRRRRLGRAGVQRAHSRYTWERVAADTEAAYRLVLPALRASAAEVRR
jgi:glycosyltransferase involved in cell wall biosynthesis